VKKETKMGKERCICPILQWVYIFLNQELINIATHLVLFIVAVTSSKKPKAPSFQIGLGRNLVDIINRWRVQDGGHGDISFRKVLPFGECTCSSCPAPAGCPLAIMCTVPDHSTFAVVCMQACC